jgi:hypothetical protein
MHELKISRELWAAVNSAMIDIDEAQRGQDIVVTIILHDREGGIYTVTDGHPDDLEIRFTDDLLNIVRPEQ